MADGFTRQETVVLTGTTSNKLSYLDRIGLVQPRKYGNSKHPTVIYNWQQVIQIKIIERLRENLSLQEVRRVLAFLEEQGYSHNFQACNLVFINSQLYLIQDWQAFGMTVLEVSGKNRGQVTIHEIGAIGEVIEVLRQEAERHQVREFEERAKFETVS